MTTKPSTRVSVDTVLSAARDRVKYASSKTIPPDPTKSAVGIPPADGTSPNLPSDSKPQNTDAAPATQVPMPETNPSKSGEGAVPAVEDGTKKEEMISPSTTTAELLKTAAAVRDLLGIPAGQAPAPSAGAVAAPAAIEGTAKTASDNDKIELTKEYHAKIASVLLSTERGRALVTAELDTLIGHQECIELVKQASVMQQEYERIGAATLEHQHQVQQAFNEIEMEKVALAREYDALSTEDQKRFDAIQGSIKIASARYDKIPNGELFQNWLIKGAAMMGEMMGDPAQMAAMQGGQAPPEMAPAGAEGGAGVEELIMMLEQLVASGEVTEEEAIQVAQILMQEAAGASPGGEIQKAASAAIADTATNQDELIKAASAL